MAICPYCGSQIGDEASICGFCGANVSAEAAETIAREIPEAIKTKVDEYLFKDKKEQK